MKSHKEQDVKSTDDKSYINNKMESLTSLHSYIPGVLTWLYNRMSSDASNAYRQYFGLGITDWRVLAFLGVNKKGTSAKISRVISLDKAATSRSMKSLKDMGLIYTTQMEGRQIELSLTQKGESKFKEVSSLAMRRERALLDGFTEGETMLLNEMLHRMLANVDKAASLTPERRKE